MGMPQSLANLTVHIIFSTRYRLPVISKDIRPILHAYMAATIRNCQCECYRAGGVEDHVHLAVRLSRAIALCKLVEVVKTHSSVWIKTASNGFDEFAWQKGYSAFSVDPRNLPKLCQYIDIQEIHHRKQDFQDEYQSLLKDNLIEFDDRYIWD